LFYPHQHFSFKTQFKSLSGASVKTEKKRRESKKGRKLKKSKIRKERKQAQRQQNSLDEQE
jgi:hypothetical protein